MNDLTSFAARPILSCGRGCADSLAHSLVDAGRKFGRQRGDRSQSLEAALEESSAKLEALLATEESSPGQRAARLSG